MTFRKSIFSNTLFGGERYPAVLLLIGLGIVAAELGCGGSSSSSTTPPPSGSTPVVSITTPPPSTLSAGASSSLVAKITGDKTNSGVTWSCSPGNSAATCGSFGPNNTVATVYTAPTTPGKVTVTVTSVADTAVSASAAVTITSSAPTVSITSPPAAMFTGAKINLAASISGDPTNAGVNWSCTPGNSAATCGSFVSASGTTATYTAPPVAGIVTIIATSNSFSTASASAPVTIVTALNGNYIFSLSGSRKSQTPPPPPSFPYSPYSVAGTFIVNGNAISAGEQDLAGESSNADIFDPTTSSITPTVDGHVLITLAACTGTDCTTPDLNVGVNGVETFNASFLPLNPNKAFLTEFDSAASASGTLNWHDPTVSYVTPTQGYIFDLNGISTYGQSYLPFSMAGVINIDGTVVRNGYLAISGTGSIFDANEGGSGNQYLGQTLFPKVSTVSVPDKLGRVTFALYPANNDFFQAELQLAGYIIDSSHIQLEEIVDAFGGIAGGMALGQGAKTGTFSSADVVGNSYVFGTNGWDTNLIAQVFGPLQLAGVLTANSDGTIGGFANYNDLSHGNGQPQSPYPITSAVYTVDGPGSGPPDQGTGRVIITGAINDLNIGPVEIAYLPLYLDGNGNAFTVVLAGTGSALGGPAFQQSGNGAFSTASLKGGYGIDATGWDHTGVNEFDSLGSISAGGNAATFVGTVDTNFLGGSTSTTSSGLTIFGQVATTSEAAANGILTGTIQHLDVDSYQNDDSFDLYLIDPAGDAIGIENDPNQLTLLYLFQQ